LKRTLQGGDKLTGCLLVLMVVQVTGLHQNYGFVEFRTEEDAEYGMKVRSTFLSFDW